MMNDEFAQCVMRVVSLQQPVVPVVGSRWRDVRPPGRLLGRDLGKLPFWLERGRRRKFKARWPRLDGGGRPIEEGKGQLLDKDWRRLAAPSVRATADRAVARRILDPLQMLFEAEWRLPGGDQADLDTLSNGGAGELRAIA